MNLKILKKDHNQELTGNILFINASEHIDGNTSQVGKQVFGDRQYRQLNLVDYKIYRIGQSLVDSQFSDDQFKVVFAAIKTADTIVLGTPVYWHMMSGYLKTLIERISQDTDSNDLKGKKIGVFIQGSNPSAVIGPTNNIIKRFAEVAGMKFIEMRY